MADNFDKGSESLNPADPVDSKLLEMKSAFEARPDRAALEARYGNSSISPSDLNAAAPQDEHELRNQRLKAVFEAGETAPPAEGESEAVNQKVDAILTERWGASRAEKTQQAGEMLREIFPTADAMVEFGRKHGIDRNPEAQA